MDRAEGEFRHGQCEAGTRKTSGNARRIVPVRLVRHLATRAAWTGSPRSRLDRLSGYPGASPTTHRHGHAGTLRAGGSDDYHFARLAPIVSVCKALCCDAPALTAERRAVCGSLAKPLSEVIGRWDAQPAGAWYPARKTHRRCRGRYPHFRRHRGEGAAGIPGPRAGGQSALRPSRSPHSRREGTLQGDREGPGGRAAVAALPDGVACGDGAPYRAAEGLDARRRARLQVRGLPRPEPVSARSRPARGAFPLPQGAASTCTSKSKGIAATSRTSPSVWGRRKPSSVRKRKSPTSGGSSNLRLTRSCLPSWRRSPAGKALQCSNDRPSGDEGEMMDLS